MQLLTYLYVQYALEESPCQPPLPRSSFHLSTFSQVTVHGPGNRYQRRCLESDPPLLQGQLSRRECGISRQQKRSLIPQSPPEWVCAKLSGRRLGKRLLLTHILSWLRQAVSSWETCRSPSVPTIWPHIHMQKETSVAPLRPVLPAQVGCRKPALTAVARLWQLVCKSFP